MESKFFNRPQKMRPAEVPTNALNVPAKGQIVESRKIPHSGSYDSGIEKREANAEAGRSEREQDLEIMPFLYEDEGVIYMGRNSDSLVTEEYYDYLKENGIPRGVKLPTFLRKEDGEIVTSFYGDCDTTESWNTWINNLD